MISSLDYSDIKFLVSKMKNGGLKEKIASPLMCLVMKMVWFIQSMYQKKLEDCMDLLQITDDNKSHYVYIKDFSRFMCNDTKQKKKKRFADIV